MLLRDRAPLNLPAAEVHQQAGPTVPTGLAKVLAQQPTIAQLCQQNAVVRLELFGSATTPNFDPATSDFDFLDEFAVQAPKGAADRFFNLKQGLSKLLKAAIDLIELKAVKNPYFLNAIAQSQVMIFNQETKP